MSLELKPHIQASPLYTAGAASEEIKAEYEVSEVVKLGSNESPLGPSPQAVEAMQKAAAGLNRYPPMGDETLRQAIAHTLGPGLTAEHIFTGNGGCDVLDMIATAFLGPGQECIICRPTFPVYELTARRVGAEITYVDLTPDQFNYDVEAILAAVTDRTRVLYLCSPNNPTGGILTADQLERLIDNLPPDLLIVSDEVYHHFVTAADYPDALQYVSAGRNLVVVHSFSKAYSLAGLRLGYGLARPELARYLARLRQPFHLSRVTVEGGLAALADAAHLSQVIEAVIPGRLWLYEQMSRLDLQLWPSQANFILFKPPLASAKLVEQLLQQGIILRPLEGFYLPEYLRVSVGLPPENERFIAALQRALPS